MPIWKSTLACKQFQKAKNWFKWTSWLGEMWLQDIEESYNLTIDSHLIVYYRAIFKGAVALIATRIEYARSKQKFKDHCETLKLRNYYFQGIPISIVNDYIPNCEWPFSGQIWFQRPGQHLRTRLNATAETARKDFSTWLWRTSRPTDGPTDRPMKKNDERTDLSTDWQTNRRIYQWINRRIDRW